MPPDYKTLPGLLWLCCSALLGLILSLGLDSFLSGDSFPTDRLCSSMGAFFFFCENTQETE